MTSQFKNLAFATERNDKEEPADLKALRTGKVPIGSGGQYGSTWEFASPRDLPMGAWYPLIQFADNDLYNDAQIVDQMKTLNQPYIPYLRYNGFMEMADLFDAAMKLAPTASRYELKLVARGFLRYFNRYTSYALFYFDWKTLGDKTPYDTSLAAAVPKVDLSRCVRIMDGQKIKLSWNSLGIVAYGYLATKENPQLANAFAQILPFKTLPVHVMVSGQSTYAWARMVTTAKAPVMERQYAMLPSADFASRRPQA